MRRIAVTIAGGLVLLATAISVLAVPSPSPMLHTTKTNAALGHQEPLLKGKQKVEAHPDVSSHQDVVMQAVDVPPKADVHTLIATNLALEPHKEGQPVKLKQERPAKGYPSQQRAKAKHAATQLRDPKAVGKFMKDFRRHINREHGPYDRPMSPTTAKARYIKDPSIATLEYDYEEELLGDRITRKMYGLPERRPAHPRTHEIRPPVFYRNSYMGVARPGSPGSLEHGLTGVQAQHNVEIEVPMELDKHAKAGVPAQSPLEGAKERLSQLHLG